MREKWLLKSEKNAKQTIDIKLVKTMKVSGIWQVKLTLFIVDARASLQLIYDNIKQSNQLIAFYDANLDQYLLNEMRLLFPITQSKTAIFTIAKKAYTLQELQEIMDQISIWIQTFAQQAVTEEMMLSMSDDWDNVIKNALLLRLVCPANLGDEVSPYLIDLTHKENFVAQRKNSLAVYILNPLLANSSARLIEICSTHYYQPSLVIAYHANEALTAQFLSRSYSKTGVMLSRKMKIRGNMLPLEEIMALTDDEHLILSLRQRLNENRIPMSCEGTHQALSKKSIEELSSSRRMAFFSVKERAGLPNITNVFVPFLVYLHQRQFQNWV